MKKNILEKITTGILAIIASMLFMAMMSSAATVLFPFQGGTGTSTVPGKGSLLVGLNTSQYCVIATSTNGNILTSSSTATCGVSWEASGSGITSFNGSTSSSQSIVTTGATGGYSWTTANGVHTILISSSSASSAGLLLSADWTTFNNKAATSTFSATAPIFYNANTATFSLGITAVSSTRAINTTAPLFGGGDLSTDRTLTLGIDAVSSTRAVNAGFGLAGGGDLSADRTLRFAGTFTGTVGQVIIASSSATWTFSLPQDFNTTSTIQLAGVTSTEIRAGTTLRIPASATCDSDFLGEICLDTTIGQLIVSSTVYSQDRKQFGFSVASTSLLTASTTYGLGWEVRNPLTILYLSCAVRGTTGSSVDLYLLEEGTLAGNTSTTQSFTCSTTATSTASVAAPNVGTGRMVFAVRNSSTTVRSLEVFGEFRYVRQ